MEFGKAINYKIIIEATDNKGFTAKVGCGNFAFSNKEDLKEAFNTFLDDPKGYEEKFDNEHKDCITEDAREEGPTRREPISELGSMAPDEGNATGMTDRRTVDRGDGQRRTNRGYLR